MLQTPPILPERTPCGEVIEVDENLAGAISHRMIFTETSQFKENQVYTKSRAKICARGVTNFRTGGVIHAV